jgi:hypothetical protein
MRGVLNSWSIHLELSVNNPFLFKVKYIDIRVEG